MRKIIVLITAIFCCQLGNVIAQVPANADSPFEKDWKIIDSLIIQKDQSKSALDRILKLRPKLKRAGVSDQFIKSLLYQFYLEDRILENQEEIPFIAMEAEIKQSSSSVEKAILHTIIAKRYLTYYLVNSWQINQISKTNTEKKQSMKTWSASSFQEKIELHFQSALAYQQELQNQSLLSYPALIIKGNSPQLRPNLFDVVANEAIDYYSNLENLSFQTAYQSKSQLLNNPYLLAPTKDFSTHEFQAKDSSDPIYQAVKIYQTLLQFHSAKNNTGAFIALENKRIEWANRDGQFQNKQMLHQQALASLTALFPAYDETVSAWLQLANSFLDQANQYHPLYQTEHRYQAVKAKQILEKALIHYPSQHLPSNELRLLLNSIQTKALASISEKVIIPNQAFPVLIKYKNITELYCRIIKISNQASLISQRWNSNFWDSVTQISPYRTSQFTLPETADFQSHSVEVKLDGLPLGEYAIVFSEDRAFSKSKLICLETIQSSMISLVKNGADLFILKRANGAPIADASIGIYKRNWDQANTKTLVEKIKTNQHGFAHWQGLINNSSFDIEITAGKDHLAFQQIYYQGFDNATKEMLSKEEIEKREQRIYFFTDRKIYRPAQELYFKGILLSKDPISKKPILGKRKDSIQLFLINPANKKIDSLKVLTNQFGSFAGKFMIPKNDLSGNYRISSNGIITQNGYVKIEEYKRPKFQIRFDPSKSSYHLGDEVVIVGNAIAFAGYAIDGSKVSYQVYREALYYPIYQNKNYPPNAFGRKEISQGSTITNQQGQFTIPFKALADDIKDSSLESHFTFSVKVTITDMNGETQSADYLANIGYTTVQFNYQLPAEIENVDSLKFPLSISNFASQLVSQKIQISIHQLNSPNQLYLKKIWERPDQFIYDKASYQQFFPFTEYNNETDPSTWTIAKKIADTSFVSSQDLASLLKFKQLPVGAYQISMSTVEENGRIVEKKEILLVNDSKHQLTAVPGILFFKSDKPIAQPTDTLTLTSSSAIKHQYLIQFKNTIAPSKPNYQFIYLEKGSQQATYLVSESDRGNIAFTNLLVFQNRFFFQQQTITIDWNNKKLAVNYQSFRNKTEPGSKETWTVQIKHAVNKTISAELLTGMYDASLDQFVANHWELPGVWKFRSFSNSLLQENYAFFGLSSSFENERPTLPLESFLPQPPYLVSNAFELLSAKINLLPSHRETAQMSDQPLNETVITKNQLGKNAAIQVRGGAAKAERSTAGGIQEESYDKVYTSVEYLDSTTGERFINGRSFQTKTPDIPELVTRKNFSETAFFYPQLQSDSLGNIVFSFTMPESLTKWKWMSMAHTEDLDFGSASAEIISQKQLMIQPNTPRFLREGDKIELTSKVVNLSSKTIAGIVKLELIDASNLQSVDGWFQNVFPVQYFSVSPGESFASKFPIQVPYSFNRPITYRFKAISDQFSDGEENSLPVVTNRMLVTEAMPFYINSQQKKELLFPNLLNNQSETLTHQSFSIEFTANPVWYAITAIPYLLEYPYECAEQSFTKLYANLLATQIIQTNPTIGNYLNKWGSDTSISLSSLAKNEGLKQSLLAETPWVLAAQNEKEAAKQLGKLLNPNELNKQTDDYFKQLASLQLPSGGFPWFSGGREDRFITNYILTGIGKLKRLGALNPQTSMLSRNLLVKAINFLDQALVDEYTGLKNTKTDLSKQEISNSQLDYLHMRSFFKDIALTNSDAHDYFLKQGKKYWIKLNKYQRAKLGIVLIRNGEEKFSSENMLSALLENAVIDSTQGMFWKDTYTQFWYQSPIEFQSMMISYLSELHLNKPSKAVSQMINQTKTWLLLNKQTNHWGNTMATADACYALLMEGDKWIEQDNPYQLISDKKLIYTNAAENPLGYIKEIVPANQVKASLGKLTIQPLQKTDNPSLAWGAMYWQYFEEIEKIQATEGPLTLTKELYLEKNTNSGKILELIKEEDELIVGNKIIVRLKITSSNDLDYVHLKDMRASNMEPTKVLSGYQWMNGLVYYESTKDLTSNYFIEHLQKGTYLFEYPVMITHAGKFSSGIASIQSMYAPEFTGHSKSFNFRVTE